MFYMTVLYLLQLMGILTCIAFLNDDNAAYLVNEVIASIPCLSYAGEMWLFW